MNIRIVLHNSFTLQALLAEVHHIYAKTQLSPQIIHDLDQVHDNLRRQQALQDRRRPALDNFATRRAKALANLTPWDRQPAAAAALLARATSSAPQEPWPAQRRRIEPAVQTAPAAAAAAVDESVDLTLDVPALERPTFLSDEDFNLDDIPGCDFNGDPFSPISLD